MGIFRRKVPNHYIPIHPDNIRKKDWVIILEAGTIIGPSTEKLRVATATQEKKIVRKYNIFLRKKHFLVVDDYDPQIPRPEAVQRQKAPHRGASLGHHQTRIIYLLDHVKFEAVKKESPGGSGNRG